MSERYVLKKKLATLTGDLYIEDDQGNKAFVCDSKILRIGRKVEIQDLEGNELYTVHHKLAHAHRTWEITTGDEKVATVQQALVSIHPKLSVHREGKPDLEVKGNLVQHDYEIHEDDGGLVARVHEAWVSFRDSYGVEIEPGYESAFVLATVLAVDLTMDMGHGN